MKKRFVVFLFSLIFILSGCGKTHFFRGVDFDMTRDEVKKAENSLEEPAEILNDDSYLYRGIVYLNTGGDVIYNFDENGNLNGIIYYAYEQYYNDDTYAKFLSDLKEKHKGYTSSDQQNSGEVTESWTITDKNISVQTEYKTGRYLVLRYQLNQ